MKGRPVSAESILGTGGPVPDTTPDSRHRLSGRLGVGAIIFMIMAAAAPLTTVSATTPVAVLIGNGPAYPIMYVLAGIILAFFAVGFTAMTPHVRNTGAFYSYVTDGLGRRWGLAAAFLALLTYSAVQLAVHAFMGVVLHDFVLSIGGPDIVWWVFSALSILVVAVLGYRNIELSGKVLGVVLVAEVLICVVFAAAVVLKGGGPEGPSTAFLHPDQILSGSPALALMFAVSGFLGFEAAAVYRDEARDPDRTIPRATYGALAVIGCFYALIAWAIISAWGDTGVVERAQTSSATMLLDAAHTYIGTFGHEVMQYLLIGSVFAGVLSFHNVIARYIFSLANTHAMPAKAGMSHPKHGSPAVASMTQSISAAVVLGICAICGLDPIAQVFTWLVGVATIGVLILMLGTCIAVIAYFRRSKVDNRIWHTLIAPGLGCIGLGVTTAITAWNLPLLMGSKPLAVVVAVLLVITLAAGFLVATCAPRRTRDLRRRRHATPYRKRGRCPMQQQHRAGIQLVQMFERDDDHPLRRLTPGEITAVREVIAGAGLLSEDTRFVYVGLDEPDKLDIRAYDQDRSRGVDRRRAGASAGPGHRAGQPVLLSLTNSETKFNFPQNRLSDPVKDGQVAG